MPALTLPQTTDIAPEDRQYSLARILLIWASVTVPMGCLTWVVTPWLIPRVTLAPGIVYWLSIIAGMAWQFVVAVIVLHGERPSWTWRTLKARLWLTPPRVPSQTGPGARRGGSSVWLIVVPAILFVALTSDIMGETFDAPMRALLPGWEMPAYTDIRSLMSPQYSGAVWLLGLAIVSNLFNYVLGEALLFHGVLLPRMEGVFGRWAWLANAVLFGLYHVHMLFMLPSIIISNMAYSWPAQRYRSAWLAVVIHGFEGVVVIAATCWVIWGQGPSPT